MKLIADFNDIPTLGLICSSQVIIRIWNRSDIVRSINQFLENTSESQVEPMWVRIQNRIKAIVRSINEIPRLLLEDMEALIIPIGFHIRAMRTFMTFSPHFAFHYTDFHESFFCQALSRLIWKRDSYPSSFRLSNLEFPVNLWTSYGTVDTERFDKILTLDDRWDIGFRYCLACTDCFEDIVRELFPLLSDAQKISFRRMSRGAEMISYWTHTITGFDSFINLVTELREMFGRRHYLTNDERNFYINLHHIYSVQELAFKFTLWNGSKSGVKYFLTHLETELCEYVLEEHLVGLLLRPSLETSVPWIPIRPREHFSDALYLLLSEVNEDVRSRLLHKYHYHILYNFLLYPFFGLFSKYANIMISRLTRENIYNLLHKIFKMECIDMHFFGYELFDDLWRICPETHKEYVISRLNSTYGWLQLHSERTMRDRINEVQPN